MRRGEELWLSVASFTDKDVSFGTDLPPQSQRWVVYRRVTRELFYRRYMLRRCQPTSNAPSCDPDCFSEQLVE